MCNCAEVKQEDEKTCITVIGYFKNTPFALTLVSKKSFLTCTFAVQGKLDLDGLCTFLFGTTTFSDCASLLSSCCGNVVILLLGCV